MYSASPATVNVSAVAAALFAAVGLTASSGAALAAGHAPERPPAQLVADRPGSCDPAFALLFAPPHPRGGRYEVCPSSEPLTAIVEPGWTVAATSPLDAFGVAGTYNRAALVHLYGGRRALTAHGWRRLEAAAGGGFESVTLISPYPDPSLRRLLPGTLIIRLILCCT